MTTDHISAEKSSSTLTTRMLKTEKDLQESRSIVAQLRLRGEQRAARGRRAAAAAAAANASEKPYTGKRKDTALNTGKPRAKQAKKKETLPMTDMTHYTASSPPPPPFYFGSDFIQPYYFPTDLSNVCQPSFAGSFQDWNHLLGEMPQSTVENGFVDPMILAAASDAYQQDNSIMANKARALSHLPPQQSLSLPGLQPSSSSTSTNSSGSYQYYEGYQLMGDEMMVDTQHN
jgi:hypothetical protein